MPRRPTPVVPDLSGTTVLLTGASSGIGQAAATRLLAAGAHLIPVGRSPERTRALADAWGVTGYTADFARLGSVRALAQEIAADHAVIDVIAHNAGGFFPERHETVDGHELTIQTNYLAPFLLHRLLTPQLLAAAAPRVVVTSSAAHRWGRLDLHDLDRRRMPYRAATVYAASKLANILFARELERRYAPHGLTAVSFHPGLVQTRIGTESIERSRTPAPRRPFQLTPQQGADPLVMLAGAPLHDDRHRYYTRTRAARPGRAARDTGAARTLWLRTEELLGLDPAGS